MKGPVLIDLEEAPKPELTPASAPVVPEPDIATAENSAVGRVAAMAARRPSRLAKLFWASLVALVSFVASVAAWEFVTGLIARYPLLGLIASALVAVFVLTCLLILIKEWLAIGRLRRIDGLRADAGAAVNAGDVKAAKTVEGRLLSLYAGRAELAEGRDQIKKRSGERFDADAVFLAAEQHLLAPLDDMARNEVEAAARQVATVTAIVPLALADLIAALTSNLRMIRRIAEIYGGRAGTVGSWRLTRAVLSHLVATGAVAVGDDLIGSIAGGGVLSKISRRFGEGIINGALTARVGVAAMEVCRPLPFSKDRKPSVTGLVRRALVGLFPGG